MKKEESFFVNLFKRKNNQEVETTELKLFSDHKVNHEMTKENEWKQEYEVIYQNYSLE
jgi:hypothetical protein